MSTHSGKFLLRMQPQLHDQLSHEAEAQNVSLNEICVRKLAVPANLMAQAEIFSEAIRTAQKIFGSSIIGCIVFGSYARGNLRASSDVDLLFVLKEGTKCTRTHLRTWDDANIVIEGYAASATFLTLPQEEIPQNVLWFEAAVDGILLFDRDNSVHNTLRRLRDLIAEGRIRRKLSHGQSYWVQGDIA